MIFCVAFTYLSVGLLICLLLYINGSHLDSLDRSRDTLNQRVFFFFFFFLLFFFFVVFCFLLFCFFFVFFFFLFFFFFFSFY